jgi:aminoglycoside N3'-acetyltransferase
MSAKYEYNKQDIEAALRSTGLGLGDSPFISSSFGMIGTLKDQSGESVLDVDVICNVFLDALRAVIGPLGTIFAPTYSYTIGQSSDEEIVVFDVNETPSAVGPFGEFLRKQPGAIRSCDPMVSVAGLGPAASILKDIAQTSYGPDCVFARLLTVDGSKVTNIGLGPNWMPFIHHADHLMRVPFRYGKIFSGWQRIEGNVRELTWHYDVPVRLPQARANAHKLGAICVEEGIFTSARIGRARIYTAGYKPFFERTIEALTEDPWTNAQGPACDVFAEERARVPDLPTDIPLPLHSVSSAQKARLYAVAEACPGMRRISYPTGTNLFGHIVPERLVLRSVALPDPLGVSANDGSVERAFDELDILVRLGDPTQPLTFLDTTLEGHFTPQDFAEVIQNTPTDGSVAVGAGEIGLAAAIDHLGGLLTDVIKRIKPTSGSD